MNSEKADQRSGAASHTGIDEPKETSRYTRWERDDSGSAVAISSLHLSGLHCAACAGIIEHALRSVDGVIGASVSASAQRASVRWDPRRTRPSAMFAAVHAAGYGAAPDTAMPSRDLRRREQRDVLWRLFVAAFLSMQVMMLATPSYVADPSDLSTDLRRLLDWGQWVLSVPVVWFAGMPLVRGAWRSVRQRRMGMDVPVALGIVVAFVASTAAAFSPSNTLGAEVYFDSLTMFLAFLWLGRYLETRARHAAAEALEAALSGLPDTTERRREDGSMETVAVDRLRAGDVVRVVAGARVPADGPLLSPAADVSEGLISGESVAVARRSGQMMLAGSINAGPPFEMQVDRIGAETRHEMIVALMRETLAQRPAAARMADRWAGPFLWTVLLLAAGSAAAWSVIDPGRALWVAVSVLIVTCPCALSLATPATVVAAAGGLARRGVLIQRLDALETMASVRQVFFDKTGTLTEEDLTLESIQLGGAAIAKLEKLCSDLGRSDIPLDSCALALAASLAQWSAHPVSRALASAATDLAEGRGTKVDWRHTKEVAGAGLQAIDPQGRRWRLGGRTWAAASGGAAGDRAEPPEEVGAEASVVLTCDGALVARFLLSEKPRQGAADAIGTLQASGITVGILSGDTAARATALARRIGVSQDTVQSGLTPQGKLGALRAAQADVLVVAMVGDGLNDAPVLAAADVSIAMGHAALAARQAADAVIISGRPKGVCDLFTTARRTVRLIGQNLAWSVAYNAVCVPLAVLGWMPPWVAGLGMAASSLAVILNAQRAASSA